MFLRGVIASTYHLQRRHLQILMRTYTDIRDGHRTSQLPALTPCSTLKPRKRRGGVWHATRGHSHVAVMAMTCGQLCMDEIGKPCRTAVKRRGHAEDAAAARVLSWHSDGIAGANHSERASSLHVIGGTHPTVDDCQSTPK